MNDVVGTTLDTEDIKEEIEGVDKVLLMIAGETATYLPEAGIKERVNST